MGIAGLLPILKPIQRPISIEAYRGQTVGVDAYVWLHRAMHGSAYDHGLGVYSEGYLKACKRWLDMFDYYGVTPYLVFDGRRLPAKEGTELERQRRRESMLQLALQHHRNGEAREATDCFRRAIDITPSIALGLIRVLKERRLPYLVAPYEADAQLAFLSLNGHLAAVVSEDSDLLVYACPRVIFKLDACGSGVEIRYEELDKVPELSRVLSGDRAKFRHLCIMSGCDYLPSVPGIGLKTANKLIAASPDYLAAIRKLKQNPRYKVPDTYARDFVQAEMTFRFQWVYDPTAKAVVHLTEPPELLAQHEMRFLGEPVTDAKLLEGLVTGFLHPDTHEPVNLLEANLNLPPLGSPFGVEVFSHRSPPRLSNAKVEDRPEDLSKPSPVLSGNQPPMKVVVTSPQSPHFGSLANPRTNPFTPSGKVRPFATVATLPGAERGGSSTLDAPHDSPTISHASLTSEGTSSGCMPAVPPKRSLDESFSLVTGAPNAIKRSRPLVNPSALGDLDDIEVDLPAVFS